MPSETAPRIGYVVKVYPRFSETFVVTEILAREALGEDLAVFALRPTDDTRFHPELARVQAPVFHLGRPTKPSALWSVLRDAAADPALADAIAAHLGDLLAAEVDDAVQAVLLAAAARRERITHLHAHFGSVATTVARLASRLTGIPYSFTAHAKDLFHESVDRAALAQKLEDAAFTVTVSDYNLAFLRETLPATGDVHRLYNGLELDRFRFRPRPVRRGPLRIAAVGRLVAKKGFDVLVDAVVRLRDAGVDVSAEIAGTGELAGDLGARIECAGVGDRVRLLGPLPQHDVARLLGESDVFVAPCVVSDDGNADGLPTVLLEAMATGIPCISTDVTGIPEIVRDGDTGVLCRAGSVEDLVAALRGFADGTTDAAGLASRARRLVEERFDSRRQASELAALTAGRRVLEEVA
ncbi:glycosyltransferase [Microbacterium oleivorans]|uniref:glycosyltransferase n=1 Tax=Microbacterium oleivorans TaxID=273677 RepID=UPI00203F427E|nr:glycosyltransferase [Microbacterium oleivorans]MCM3697620.1 glycosyltransferase [Microbacterium oleivorans]